MNTYYSVYINTEMMLIKFVLMKAFQFQLRAQLLRKLLPEAIQSVKYKKNYRITLYMEDKL